MAASNPDSFNENSSEESTDDVQSLDFSSDSDISSQRPGTSATVHMQVSFQRQCVDFITDESCLFCFVRVSTTYSGDIWPNAPRRVKSESK